MTTFYEFLDSHKPFFRTMAIVGVLLVFLNLIVAIFRWKMNWEQVHWWLAEKSCEFALVTLIAYGIGLILFKVYNWIKSPTPPEEPVTPPIHEDQDSGIGM